MLILYLITVLISYIMLRETVKKKLTTSNQLIFEEIAILIVMLLIPVLNFIISLSVMLDVMKNKDSASSLIERFFFIK